MSLSSMPAGEAARHASLVVIDPDGRRTRVELRPVPFRIGRQADNHLVIRDSRASRLHAQIIFEGGEFLIEDAKSRHGVFVNGSKVDRRPLRNNDRIEFGVPDSYQLIFALDGVELGKLMDHLSHPSTASHPHASGAGGNLAKLRAVLEVARTLQTAFSMQDVLVAVVDAALAITGAERGFLLLRREHDLETRVARDHKGAALSDRDLRVPRRVIHRALQHRRELLSMNFDPTGGEAVHAEKSVADLDLRSVVCVPLVRIHAGASDATNVLSGATDTVGLLYLDSRAGHADLAGGNRELLQTLAIEASTVLENVRLMEEERIKRKIEEELNVARTIQQSLLPRSLPTAGWFRAAGSSVASHQVGGDYFDAIRLHETCWATVVADVAGKGVSSALLASLLQGAFFTISDRVSHMEQTISHINRFLSERNEGGKYATIFFSLLEQNGSLHYINAGHCAPLLVRAEGGLESLETTSMPVGLVPEAEFPLAEAVLRRGDRLIVYSDGVTEAQSLSGEFFGRKRLREVVAARSGGSCVELHDAIQEEVAKFTEGALQFDDITLVVIEFQE